MQLQCMKHATVVCKAYTNGIDVTLVSSEGLSALPSPDIPQLCGGR